MEQVRLIALDLDGTLLDDRKEVPPENISALEEAQGRGILVAISSGRMIPRILPVEERLGLDCIILAYNGGKVVGPRAEGRPGISERPRPADIAEIFIRFSREGDYLLNFYHDDVLYSEDSPNRRRFMEIYSGRTGAEYHIEDLSGRIGQEPTKLILLAEPDERDRLHDRFTAELGDRAYITKSAPEYLEIMAPGVSKGTALEALGEHYGFSLPNVLAIGDAENDNPMLEAAGIGVVVANGTAASKAVADYVTERTNNEGGVAEAVRRFALK
ncbi:MAG: Cof-type HAD-IIB family hydrolase [Planctomycetes bacterium]|nr:Cof-type HAD-IIB family hydrolase [Planctomycetota bacterium]